jgi:hypothetical protein
LKARDRVLAAKLKDLRNAFEATHAACTIAHNAACDSDHV